PPDAARYRWRLRGATKLRLRVQPPAGTPVAMSCQHLPGPGFLSSVKELVDRKPEAVRALQSQHDLHRAPVYEHIERLRQRIGECAHGKGRVHTKRKVDSKGLGPAGRVLGFNRRSILVLKEDSERLKAAFPARGC